jgi:hypothetical protein
MVAKLRHSQRICKLAEHVFKELLNSTKECKGLELNKSRKVNKNFEAKNDVKDKVESGSNDNSKKKAKPFKHVRVILKLWDFQKNNVR